MTTPKEKFKHLYRGVRCLYNTDADQINHPRYKQAYHCRMYSHGDSLLGYTVNLRTYLKAPITEDQRKETLDALKRMLKNRRRTKA